MVGPETVKSPPPEGHFAHLPEGALAFVPASPQK
jgi:hypothetical protein